jgi:hypothetical protein
MNIVIKNHSSARPSAGIKGLFVVLILALCLSCKQQNPTDTRPPQQRAFAGVVKTLKDQAERIPFADANRPVILDDGVNRLKSYITDTLNLKFDNWDARVLDNKMTDPDGSDHHIAFGISIDDFNLDETSRFKSVVFRESVNNVQPPLRDKLKQLKVGDHVKISGSFVTRDKKINIDPYNLKEFRVSKNIFLNPQFRTDISNIVLAED